MGRAPARIVVGAPQPRIVVGAPQPRMEAAAGALAKLRGEVARIMLLKGDDRLGAMRELLRD